MTTTVATQRVEEIPVKFDTSVDEFPDFDFFLAPIRIKEIENLKQVYIELGPLPVSIYCGVLLCEISQATNNSENDEQFCAMKSFLAKLKDYCIKRCSTFGHGGRTDKLVKLEAILRDEIPSSRTAKSTRGIIFLDMRITVMTLYCYFQECNNLAANYDIRSDFLVRR